MKSDIKYDRTDEFIEKAIRKVNEGDRDAAISIYEKIIKKKPNHLDANFLLGTLYAEKSSLERAKTLLERAAKIEPSSPFIQNNLGNVYRLSSQFHKAISCFKQAVEYKRDFVEAHMNLGMTYKVIGDPDRAVKHYKIAKKLNPSLDTPEIHTASILEQKGDYKKAYKKLDKLIKKGDRSVAIIQAFSSVILHGDFREKEVKRALGLLENITKDDKELEKIPLNERANLFMTLGTLLDNVGSYSAAFNAFKTGNDLHPTRYDDNIIRNQVDRLKKIFSSDLAKNMPLYEGHGNNLIFIIGMPRSGSTLIEQILASHNNVEAMGETGYVAATITKKSKALKIDPEEDFKEILKEKELSKIHSYFYEKTKHNDEKNNILLTDKTLNNYLYLGYIAQLFPEAKVINCLRDPLDTGLSCYFHSFTGQWDVTNDLESIGIYYRHYESLMEHWFNCLPLKMIKINYEDVIENPKKMTKKILDFCELKWSRKCLKFYKNKRFVSTASYYQVRKPIYSSSIKRHEKYIEFLSPLQKGLDSG